MESLKFGGSGTLGAPLDNNTDAALAKLSQSPFRSRFHLSAADRAYALEKGDAILRAHAQGFITARLAPAVIPNDGKQTPMKGHPVFVAQHACACCCRGCLEKWHHIPRSRALTEIEMTRIVNLIMAWIRRDLATVRPPLKHRKLSPQGELF